MLKTLLLIYLLMLGSLLLASSPAKSDELSDCAEAHNSCIARAIAVCASWPEGCTAQQQEAVKCACMGADPRTSAWCVLTVASCGTE